MHGSDEEEERREDMATQASDAAESPRDGDGGGRADEAPDPNEETDDKGNDEDDNDEEDEEDDDGSNQDPNARRQMAGLFRRQSTSTDIPDDDDPASPAEWTLLVVLQPDGVRHRVTVTAETTVQTLTEQICNDLRLEPEMIAFPDLNPAPGRTLPETTLQDAGVQLSTGGEERSVLAYVTHKAAPNDYVMPDRIQVQVYDEEKQAFYSVTVGVTKFTGHKPYLGGFRHRKTLQIFHHASTQTIETRARRHYGPRAHRDTQTQELTTRSAQTNRESGTQMERRDLRIETTRDRHLSARPYFDSYQVRCLQEDAVMLLQRRWRGFQARMFVHNLYETRRRAELLGQRAAHESAVLDSGAQQREIQRRMQPKTVGDFEVLYNELDKWRQVETRRVDEDRSLHRDARQAALEAILAKETKLLQTIDRLKLTATDGNRTQRIESMLEYMARPKLWQMSDGGVKEVHTPFTTRAKELMDLYHGIKAHLISMDERLDVLLHVKWTVKEFDCALTREIIELIDREADMLNRGRKEKSLEGLRKRLNNLFLQFIETPEFNPEAAAVKRGAQ